MRALVCLSRSLRQYSVEKPNPFQPSSLISIFKENLLPPNTNQWIYQTRRTLILEPTFSKFVKLHRFSDSDSGILEVSLDRPEAKNAIGKEMLRGFQHTLEAISRDSSANVMLLRSSVPRVFCAGADLKERKTMNPDESRSFVNSLRATFSFLETLCLPTIAVIEGAALGGGLEMALSCDLRICGEDAILGLPETGLAIIPGCGVQLCVQVFEYPIAITLISQHFERDKAKLCEGLIYNEGAGGTQRLPRLIGKAKAKELIFTGRKVGGRDAMSIGLVNYCVPAGEAHLKALEIARDINDKGPIAIRMAKKAISEGLEVNMEPALALEEDCYEQLLNTKDRLEGLAAFAEKRKPRYTGE